MNSAGPLGKRWPPNLLGRLAQVNEPRSIHCWPIARGSPQRCCLFSGLSRYDDAGVLFLLHFFDFFDHLLDGQTHGLGEIL